MLHGGSDGLVTCTVVGVGRKSQGRWEKWESIPGNFSGKEQSQDEVGVRRKARKSMEEQLGLVHLKWVW